MAATEFDVLVLGAGSGGYACALRAAQLGLTVGLVEKDKLGGTCLHVGCIPTKALLHSAEIADNARESEQFGVHATFDGIDMPGVNAYKDGVVSRLFKGLSGLIKGRGITVVEGAGVVTGPREVTVDGEDLPGPPPGAGHRLLLAHPARPRDRRHPRPHLRAGPPTRPRARLGRGAGRRRHRLRVRQRVAQLRRRGHHRRGAPPAGGRRGRSLLEGARAHVPQAQDRLPHQHVVPERHDHRRRRRRHRRGADGESSVIEAELLLVAVGRGPTTSGLGLRRARRHHGSRLRADRRALPYQRRGRVRRGRHRAGAAARPPRLRRRASSSPRTSPGSTRAPSTRPASRASPTPGPSWPRSV